MFLERQELDVREAHLSNVVCERLGHLAICKRTIVFFRVSSPRAEVDFVDREWLAEVFAAGAILHPLRIAKLVPGIVDNRRSVRRSFCVLRVRICFEKRLAARSADFKLVQATGCQIWDEEFPDA